MAHFSCNFASYTLHRGAHIEVTIPSVASPDFFSEPEPSHTPKAKYPVLYLLHGFGNDEYCWQRYTSADRYAEENQIAIVSCTVSNSFYVDLPSTGEMYYQFLRKELPEFICGYFPISDRKEDTYICGYSMGGFGALFHALSDTEQYQAVGAFSPAITPDVAGRGLTAIQMPDLYQVINGDLENEKKLPPLFLGIGKNDFLYPDVEKFHTELQQRNIPHRYDAIEGYEHEFAIWDKELLEFIRWLPRTDAYAGKLHKI